MLFPRGTTDPGALLPGSMLVALTITVMHASSELYLPDRLDRASQLYGALGTTIVTLGWFFILGRAIVIAMELNAAVYERYGNISQLVFLLPIVRALPRRSARLRRLFDLEWGSRTANSLDGAVFQTRQWCKGSRRTHVELGRDG